MIAAYQQPYLLLYCKCGACLRRVYLAAGSKNNSWPQAALVCCATQDEQTSNDKGVYCDITLKKGRVESKKERQTAGRTSTSCDKQIRKQEVFAFWKNKRTLISFIGRYVATTLSRGLFLIFNSGGGKNKNMTRFARKIIYKLPTREDPKGPSRVCVLAFAARQRSQLT